MAIVLPPPKKIARSVFADSSTSNLRVYVGSFEEFGYFQRNAQNRLVYTSLKDQLKGYSFHNDEVWQIFKYQGKIYFQTFSSYFVYDGSQVQAFNLSRLLLQCSLMATNSICRV